ncbi:hypothetical protein MPF_1598 [Methanohalophilus portucalensis FDF-1]|uniref:Uncharacterized protein n=1 Tax=Methanohalophilus portucalensis FDF-1 TaxID=523843 RepID=A0A1L9C3Q9_9EURY|nr:hypothetical protein MPF_1598 [Methanohalophilus portucalensis FDF-1]
MWFDTYKIIPLQMRSSILKKVNYSCKLNIKW